ncbi:MAG: phosphoenolpyruvate carboxylase, partial [Saprospiraceae bacterium]|nr:phosphoenolpyruvate carboxylase [Saprospiraceae bacterium]
PTVTSDTTLEVAQLLNRSVLRGYYREIREVRRRLTFSGVEEKIIEVDRRIYSTLFEPGPDSYHTCQELLADLQEARNVLIEEHSGLFLDILDRFILKIKVFGFYFASIDIRQDSRKHDEVWNPILAQLHQRGSWPDLAEELNEPEQQRISRLLRLNFTLDENDYADPFLKETLRSIRAIFDIQKQNGEAGCHRYIISNCQCAYHVAEVLSLAQLVYSDYEENWKDNAQPPLDIVPLFETIDDLKSCDSVMETLYTNPEYLRHLRSRNMAQHIMLGFSDGTKDGGYLRANWSIYRAKEALTRISRQYGVTVTFFDGRGGPPGRGGGNNVMYYAAQGKDIENKGIQVTIQGQTVSSTYGTLPSAQFNVERLLVAGLENRMSSAASTTMSEEDMHAIDALADSAYKAYLELKNDPSFVPYLEKKTALRWYGDSNIASRPTKRNADAGLKFEDLRAIPFVGAWAQMKQNVPGYHGVGSAIQAQGGAEAEQIKGLYERSLFFRTLLDNSMQALKKSNFDATRYLSSDPEFGAFWKKLNTEFELTTRQLELLSGRKVLASNPLSLKSIELREQIVLPLIAIQQYALQQIENDNTTDEMAEVYRRMALRAMFGIINAARNAA